MRIAIVGFGVVGKSMLGFVKSELGRAFMGARKPDLMVWDSRSFSEQELQTINEAGARAVTREAVTLGEVMSLADLVMVSPGVNMNRYKHLSHKIICELDLLKHFFDLRTVGITGSLGKTTTTKLLGLLVGQSRRVEVGGNIGLGMLDLISRKNDLDVAVLELSSFQLEFNKAWAPDVAVWTNCFANHLDRHETMAAYVDAKINILRHQSSGQAALLSVSLFEGDVEPLLAQVLAEVKSQLYLVSAAPISCELLKRVPRASFRVLFVEAGQLVMGMVVDGQLTTSVPVCMVADLPPVTFLDNWLHVFGALYALGIDLSDVIAWLREHGNTISLDNEHRCELVATVRGVDFYNDSKATVIQSTEAAVRRLAATGRPVILILGGLGKGVDRSPLLAVLKNIDKIKKIYCFGKECGVFKPAASCYATLEEVMADVMLTVLPGDQVLFSPSGTSFDLYKNYEERGKTFKALVAQIK